jgi:hypothetical protein
MRPPERDVWLLPDVPMFNFFIWQKYTLLTKKQRYRGMFSKKAGSRSFRKKPEKPAETRSKKWITFNVRLLSESGFLRLEDYGMTFV